MTKHIEEQNSIVIWHKDGFVVGANTKIYRNGTLADTGGKYENLVINNIDLTTKDQEIKKIVEGLRKEINKPHLSHEEEDFVYNQALDDVLKAISNNHEVLPQRQRSTKERTQTKREVE